MNIGIVTVWFERGAGYVSRAYREMLEREHRVFVFARGGERYGRGDPGWDDADVTWSESVPGMMEHYIDYAAFARWVRRNRLDAVIFNEQHSWEVVVRARSLGIPLGSYVDFYTPETVPFFGLYDFLLCNTARHHGVFAWHPQALFIPWGTDLSVFRPLPRAEPGDGVTFFHSCGLSAWRKGTDLAVRAFQAVGGPARLVIHAQAPLASCFAWTTGDEAGETLRLVAQDPRIEVVEREVGAPGLYRMGEVYVYPTRLEGIGLTMAEACACGLPVIATDAAPMNELVRDGVNGRLVAVAREERRWDGYYWPMSICAVPNLTAAMQAYVDRRGELTRMRAEARAYAERHLDWKRNAAALPGRMSALRRVGAADDPGLRRRALAFDRARARYPWLPTGWECRLRTLGATRLKGLARRAFGRKSTG